MVVLKLTFNINFGKYFRLANTINDAFDYTILVNFFISTIAICFIAFVIMFGDPEQTVKGVLFLSACMLQIWIICFMGQMLIDSVRLLINIRLFFIICIIHRVRVSLRLCIIMHGSQDQSIIVVKCH